MQSRNFDLNLFKVLVALFDERSVSRAAARLGRTQSAISNSLRKLREAMDDPLFVRGPDGLTLTPRARTLEDQARAIVHMSDTVLADSAPFDPGTASGRFRIGAPDRLGLPVILPFFQSLRALAPHTALHLITADRETALSHLDADELDLVFGWTDHVPPRFDVLLMFRERFACLCRRGHPILRFGGSLDLPMVLSFPHLVVSVAADNKAAFDIVLARMGKQRETAVLVPHFLMVPSLLKEDGNLIGVYTQRIADRLARDFDLVTKPIAAGVEPLDQYMIWHRRYETDRRHGWFRERLMLACRQA
ncbi:MAG: LysR family transcriptional regulator [Defluviicoccus sp.]|nr:LysR family transcriptional regulator [Defluviicoccus sp.]